jgi:uncharacterized protein
MDAAKAALRQERLDQAAALPASQLQQLGDVNQWADKQVDTAITQMTSPGYMHFLAYDPAPALQKVTVPVLALFGGKDLQVPAGSNRDAVMAALDKGGNKDHSGKVFPDANHLFQMAITGHPAEYTQLKPEFAAGFLDTIVRWIQQHFPVAGS